MVGFIIAIVIAVIVIAYLITAYNKLVRLRNKVKNSFAQVDTLLQRRFDLIPNLVETVKGYQIHEKEVLEHVAAYRSGFLSATSNEQKLEMANGLSESLRRLFATTEAYPDLKANASFLALQQELGGTEDKLTYARQFYNDAVTIYNDSRLTFPTNIIASMFGFKEEKLFETVAEAYKAPAVHF